MGAAGNEFRSTPKSSGLGSGAAGFAGLIGIAGTTLGRPGALDGAGAFPPAGDEGVVGLRGADDVGPDEAGGAETRILASQLGHRASPLGGGASSSSTWLHFAQRNRIGD